MLEAVTAPLGCGVGTGPNLGHAQSGVSVISWRVDCAELMQVLSQSGGVQLSFCDRHIKERQVGVNRPLAIHCYVLGIGT